MPLMGKAKVHNAYYPHAHVLTGGGAPIWFECGSEFGQALQRGARPNAVVLGDGDGAL